MQEPYHGAVAEECFAMMLAATRLADGGGAVA